MAVTRKVIPKRKGRPKGSKNKATIERKAKEVKLTAHKIEGVAVVSPDMNQYELLVVARDAMRERNVMNTWRKLMYELYSAHSWEAQLTVLGNYVNVKVI